LCDFSFQEAAMIEKKSEAGWAQAIVGATGFWAILFITMWMVSLCVNGLRGFLLWISGI
jgi:hypothetical protein